MRIEELKFIKRCYDRMFNGTYDPEELQKAYNELEKSSHEISAKLYQQQQASTAKAEKPSEKTGTDSCRPRGCGGEFWRMSQPGKLSCPGNSL